MTGSNQRRDPHGGADPYSKLAHAQAAKKRTPWIIGGAAVVVLVLALIAVLVTRDSGGSSGGSGKAGTGTGAAAAAKAKQETAEISVIGEPLPDMPDSGGQAFTSSSDPAIGRSAPKLEGESFDGSKVTVDPGDGTPKVIMFVAHWCPHCQKELPLVQKWIDEGNLPKGVEIVVVSTGVNSGRPNYPPSAWIKREGITPPVLVDDVSSGASARYGLTGFPYFVMTNGQGKVVARGSGEVPIETFGAAVKALAAGQDPIAATG